MRKLAIILSVLTTIIVTVAQAAREIEREGKWIIITDSDLIYDAVKSIAIIIESDDGLNATFGFTCFLPTDEGGVRIKFVPSPQLYVFPRAFTYTVDIVYRIDGLNPVDTIWLNTGDKLNPYLNRKDATEFLGEIYNANELILRAYGDGKETEVTHRFDITGISKQIDKIADQCTLDIKQ